MSGEAESSKGDIQECGVRWDLREKRLGGIMNSQSIPPGTGRWGSER